jgi:exopolysaccharide production protein ExoQ
MHKYLLAAERGFVVLSLIFYSSGPLPLILSGGGGEGLSERVFPNQIDYSQLQTIFFLTYIIAATLLIIRWKKAVYTLSKDWTVWLLMAVSLGSIVWSATPALTQVRSIALVGTSLFGLYLGSRYSIREQLRLLGWSFALIIIMSFLFAILTPRYGTMYMGVHEGAWRGIYVHKNVLGKVMALSGSVFVLLALNSKENRWFAWTGLGLSFCLLFLSKSSSSMINFLTMLISIPIYSTFRWRYHVMVPAIIAIITIGGVLSLWFNENAAMLLGSIGKDPSLTGRTDIWIYIVEMIWRQPWLGYGYSAFWNDWDSPGAYVWYSAKWIPPNAHNGFLDLWLELGLVGILLFGIGFWQTVLRGLAWLRVDKSWDSFWPLLCLTYLILSNLSESALLSRNDIFCVLYISVLFSLAITNSKMDKMSIPN